MASHVPNRQVVLVRNRFYRGPRPANVDRVVVTIGGGLEACRVAVERNELDYCGSWHPRPIQRSQPGTASTGGRFFFEPALQTYYFAFNHDRPAFKGVGQIPLKQAINWAIDRPALVRASGYLGGKRTDQILPPVMGRDASIYPLGGVTEQSLARARALLAKAQFKPEKLVLYAINGGGNAARAQVFQFNLRRLGIDVEIKYFSPDALYEKAGTRGEPFDVVFAAVEPRLPGSGQLLRPCWTAPRSERRATRTSRTSTGRSTTGDRSIDRLTGPRAARRGPIWTWR